MKTWSILLSSAMLAGCVSARSVECADGTRCAEGRVCDLVHGLCVTEGQTTACNDLVDSDRCSAGDFAGICDQRVCIPGCGDGVQDSEECDDGNYASHDGCSSRCTLESASWTQWQSVWTPRARHTAAYHESSGKLVVFGGTDENGPRDDHWERGTDRRWTLRALARPPARMSASMAYDDVHHILVLFGGTTDVATATAKGLADTWTFDGTSWTKLTPATSPPPRWGASMAYAGNGRVVLFGGREAGLQPKLWYGDTWEFDGTTWTEITTSGPPARHQAMMTWAPFLSGADRVVLYGGEGDNGGAGGLLSDHWEYTSGAGWQARTGVNAPVYRRAAAMAYDSGRDRVVMFGGALDALPLASTWEYDGSIWAQVTSLHTPAGRINHTMTALGSSLVVIGGTATSDILDDIWAFSMSDWSSAPSPAHPLVRGELELVFDTDLQQTVALGGLRDPGSSDEVYRFDGERWSLDPVPLLTHRSRFVAEYDSFRHRTVMFGGISISVASTETVTQNGTAWESYLGAQPPGRNNGAMAFMQDTHQVLLFGGRNGADQPLADTWTFDTAWTQLAATGPVASVRAAMDYDPIHQRVVLFDEQGTTWALRGGVWETIATTGPSPRTAAALVFDPAAAAIVLYGGVSALGQLQDLWKLTDDGWIELDVVGEQPPARQDPRIVAHRPLRSLLLHAGTASGRRLDDTWLLQYRSDVPDEVCNNDVDDDGDRRIDGTDPDCE